MILNMDIYNEVCLCLSDLVNKTVESVDQIEKNYSNEDKTELNQPENCNLISSLDNHNQSKDVVLLFEHLKIENENSKLLNENLFIYSNDNTKLSTIFKVDMLELIKIAFCSLRLYNLRSRLQAKKMPKIKRLNKVVDKNLFHDVDKLSLIRVYDSLKLNLISNFDLNKKFFITENDINKNICLSVIKRINNQSNQSEKQTQINIEESFNDNFIPSTQKPNDDHLFLIPAIPLFSYENIMNSAKSNNEIIEFEFSTTQPFDLSVETLTEPLDDICHNSIVINENTQRIVQKDKFDNDSSAVDPKIDRKFLDFVSISYETEKLKTPSSSQYILTQCGTFEKIIHKNVQNSNILNINKPNFKPPVIDSTQSNEIASSSKVVVKPLKKRRFMRIGLSKNLKIKKPLHSNLIYKE